MNSFPSVSIVIVNMNGKRHLNECFTSIKKLNYPKDKVEIVLVDNGSVDGSAEFTSEKFPAVKIICNEHNEGFAKPSNDGAREASGEYVAFINNDMRVEKDWLIELINSLKNDGAECAGSVIQSWDGKRLDFAGGGISFQGNGYQDNYNEPMTKMNKILTEDKDILFACGGAMIVNRDIFLKSGGFDEDYFAYFEDVDLGWRLHVLGIRVVLSVKSRVNHKHNSTSKTMPKDRIRYLFERNKLYTCYKNYGDDLISKAFFPSVLLDIRETYLNSGIDTYNYNINSSAEFDDTPVKIGDYAAMKLTALNEFIQNLPKYKKKRDFIQNNRKNSDEDIVKLMSKPFIVLPKDTAPFLSSEYELVKLFGTDKAMQREFKCKVLLISNDNIGVKMAGPGIRYWEISKALANTQKFDVELACPNECSLSYEGINIIPYTPQNPVALAQAAKEAVIVMFQGFVLDNIPVLKDIVKDKYVIVDIYDPLVIEVLETTRDQEVLQKSALYNRVAKALDYQLKLGDFFVCSNEKQKDFWLGMFAEMNKINPVSYGDDPSAKSLIETVPFGISDTAPVHSKNVLKGVWPGINKDDKVLIWGGGVWNWFDPLTLIRAVKKISQKRTDVKLFFMGVKHPNPLVNEIKMLNKAVELAKELDIYDKYVFFNFGWVDYADRQNYLTEADIGVSNHFDTLETRLSFRTRILDYLWADLPIVCTTGDYFAHLIDNEKLGKTVPYKDSDKLADAILELLENPEEYKQCKENVARIAENYKWSKITSPIVKFCEKPVNFKPYKTSEELEEDMKAAYNTAPMGTYYDDSADSDDEPEESEDVEYSESKTEKAEITEKIPNVFAKVDNTQVLKKLAAIKRQQDAIQKQLNMNSRRLKNSSEKITDINEWTELNERRFVKLKAKLSKMRMFKRFLG